MQLNTMAMKISDKNWSVAAAILGNRFAAIPFPEIAGNYVVINSFSNGGYDRFSRVRRNFDNELTLNNFWLSAEEFNHMYDYDKRTKNLEQFFGVTQVNDRPQRKTSRDARIEEHVTGIQNALYGEDEN